MDCREKNSRGHQCRICCSGAKGLQPRSELHRPLHVDTEKVPQIISHHSLSKHKSRQSNALLQSIFKKGLLCRSDVEKFNATVAVPSQSKCNDRSRTGKNQLKCTSSDQTTVEGPCTLKARGVSPARAPPFASPSQDLLPQCMHEPFSKLKS